MKKNKKNKRNKFWIILFLILIIGIFGLKIYSYYFLKISAPNLIGKDINFAKTILKKRGLNIAIKKEIYSNGNAKGVIVSQSPSSGNQIKYKQTVYVVLSKGRPPLQISGGNKTSEIKAPSLIGLSINEAKKEVKSLGLKIVIKGEKINGDSQIIKQSPNAGEIVSKNFIIVECIKMTIVPDLKGLKLNMAIKKLESSNLKTGQKEFILTDMASSDTIVGQNPEAELEVPCKTPVDLIIAK